MSTLTDAAGSSAAAPVAARADDAIAAPAHEQTECAKTDELPPNKPQQQSGFLHSPPDSNNNLKSDASESELSDLDEEPLLSDAPGPALPSETGQDDIGEVLPDHWSGTVPVFKPTMHQFKDFKRFMEAVDSYGMKSGIIKIIPPSEWKDSLPPIDDLVKQVRVREPIKQDIMGSGGTYRQVNILHGRSYNLPQWRQLCDQSEHQPPARRGERRANAQKARPARRAAAPKPATEPLDPSKKRGRGRPRKHQIKEEPTGEDGDDRPMTPVSPKHRADAKDKPVLSIEKEELGEPVDEDDSTPRVGRMGVARAAKSKTQSISARRKYSKREGSAVIDEAAFKDWDYHMDISEYTPERCAELERVYWKTLTYAQPLYGADLMGTLFDESTEQWNLNKLPNLLDVLGTKVPGVNTAYLYLGMWKATFAWHLEDVDLYSINYLHFGAPKQWYSISQADARRFEAAMKSIWPQDAKACDQFLRHKAFLISPQHLQQHYGIKVNRCLSYPGEFVVTYPYGYHSGYNLGYNCAEAVNFALDSWLDLAKVAKKCDCAQAQDSVWVNVYEIERKLRGESTEYEETDDEDDEDDDLSGLPTPPAAHGVKFNGAGRKRKRGPGDKGKTKVKKIRFRLGTSTEAPCCLCPNEFPASELLPTDNGHKAHRLCAMYLPETCIDTVDGKEVVSDVEQMDQDRLGLKCMYCRSRRGACFQCSDARCTRAYHATCAAAAGVFVEEQDVPIFGEDGTEYKEQGFEFSCRFHRTKRDRKLDAIALEADQRTRSKAAALEKGDICQVQYLRGEIFAGCVVENRHEDRTLLLDILPNGDRLEVEWKWLLLPNLADYRLPKASAKAIPMPTSREAKAELKAKRKDESMPRKGDVFGEGYTWAELKSAEVNNPAQAKTDFTKSDQLWHYLGKSSTEIRAQYTEDTSKPQHNPRSVFLDTVPRPPRPAPPRPVQHTFAYTQTSFYNSPYSSQGSSVPPPSRSEKPYVYKPKDPVQPNFAHPFTSQRFKLSSPVPPQPAHAQQLQQQHLQQQHLQQQHSQQQPPQQQPPQQQYPQQHPQQHPQPQHPQHVHNQHQDFYTTRRFDVKAQQIPLQPPTAPHHQPSPAQQTQHQPRQWSASPAVPNAPNAQTGPHQGQVNRFVLPPNPHPGWQRVVHPSVYQKYRFFQVNCNRVLSDHRTPYSAWGGFTNGYEGDIRAYYTANQQDLMRRSSLATAFPSSPYAPTPPTRPRSYQSPIVHPGAQPPRPAPQESSHRPNPFSHAPRYEPSTGAAPRQHHMSSAKTQYMTSNRLFQEAMQPQAIPQQLAGQQAFQKQAFQQQASQQQALGDRAPQQAFRQQDSQHRLHQQQFTQQPMPQQQLVHPQSAPRQQVHPQPAPQQQVHSYSAPQQQVPSQPAQQQAHSQSAPLRKAHTQQVLSKEFAQTNGASDGKDIRSQDVAKVDDAHKKPALPKEAAQEVSQTDIQQAPNPGPMPIHKTYKVPPKESPVPLPANFLAAMTSTPLTPTSAAKAPPPISPSKGPAPRIQKQPSVSPPKKLTVSEEPKTPALAIPAPQPTEQATSPMSSPVSSLASFPGPSPMLSPVPAQRSPAKNEQPGSVPGSGRRTRSMTQAQNPPLESATKEAGDVSDNNKTNNSGIVVASGGGSTEFVERLMRNLRRASRRGP